VKKLGMVLLVTAACGSVGNEKNDAPAGPKDAPRQIDVMPDSPYQGTMGDPATSCKQLQAIGKGTGSYYLRDPGGGAAFETICDMDRNNGGWALVYRSLFLANGTTTQFWQIPYAQRMTVKGAPLLGQNFYAPMSYRAGREYMDIISDINDKTVIAMVATTTGFDEATMKFADPMLVVGNSDVFNYQFAAGWSASDYDGDTYANNCALEFNNVSQNYGSCWVYNLGSDADAPTLDGGVGPHMGNAAATALALAVQSGGGAYTRVHLIERYARW
jgi:hypothetical protein